MQESQEIFQAKSRDQLKIKIKTNFNETIEFLKKCIQHKKVYGDISQNILEKKNLQKEFVVKFLKEFLMGFLKKSPDKFV